LSQMLMMFFLIAVGFLLRKKNVLPVNAHVTLSKAETNIFTPALSMYSMITKCTVENFAQNWQLMLYGLILCLAAIGAAYLISRFFVKKEKRDSYERNLYKYALTFGNFGFMGNFIILGIFGEDVFFKYVLFTFFISILCNSWGLYVLIPKDQGTGLWKKLKKGLLTTPLIALLIGIILGMVGAQNFLPAFMLNALESAGKCQGPVAMVLAGLVIGGYRFKETFTNKKVYVVSLLRLTLIPAGMMLAMHLLGASKELMTLALVCFATPIGLNTIVFPAAYGGETKTGASMAMISHLLSVVTLPLMYLLFIEVL
ncbi:MAG: AEC family transporter, partial [Clostridia bacterium]|nr:AEC family transporter [Clostridia bacterium]